MARASTFTLLALDRYAQILGISPPHFNQGVSNTVLPITNRCSDVWWQYQWQAFDQVGREDLALAIANAERDIADYLGWWPAPVWIEQEVHMYPRHHRPDVYRIGAGNVRYQGVSVKLDYGKVIAMGQRAVTLIASPSTGAGTLAFTDEDGDGFAETATVTAATTETNACRLRVYFYDQDGDQEWEIRPARTKQIAGGTFTATFWSWQLVDPELWEVLPVVDQAAIELDDAVYVTQVDVYSEYTDTTAVSAAMYWENEPSVIATCSLCGGTGCAACLLVEQEGCAHLRDAVRGVVVPTPATYSDGWASDAWAVCRDPDQVKLYYCSGDLAQKYLKGKTCDPLDYWWAQTIAMLATARLERPFCQCGALEALARDWMEDLAVANSERTITVPFQVLDNPFGTRRGEVNAWQRVSRLARKRLRGATAI